METEAKNNVWLINPNDEESLGECSATCGITIGSVYIKTWEIKKLFKETYSGWAQVFCTRGKKWD